MTEYTQKMIKNIDKTVTTVRIYKQTRTSHTNRGHVRPGLPLTGVRE